ncbi:MAG: hypothetical protein PWQ57_2853 [Desulfovibrionales bacterium]|jgi:HPt (histidine-containing phosphotransfer) domain-containing protein|nr:hypothetical protein [Desulfovibrionales bacterium]
MSTVTERIDADLEELIPLFLENTRKEVEEMKSSLAQRDFETLSRLGHSTKGAALGYGFQTMGGLGLQIEDAAKNGSATQAQVLIDKLENYLDHVEIVYV